MEGLDTQTVLIGVVVMALTVSSTLALLVHNRPAIARILFGMLAISLVSLVGFVAVDLSLAALQTVALYEWRPLSDMAATHRRLLIMLPILLVSTSLAVLSVYHERITEKHARDYRNAVVVSTGISLIASIAIAIESVI